MHRFDLSIDTSAQQQRGLLVVAQPHDAAEVDNTVSAAAAAPKS